MKEFIEEQMNDWVSIGMRKEETANKFSTKGEAFYIAKKEAADAFDVAHGYYRVLRDMEEMDGEI